MQCQPLFSVGNHHTAAAGTPPRVSDEDAAVYRGYVENAVGEQAIFLYERASGRGTLYLGDAGWEQPHAAHNGAVPGLVLSQPEQMWLQGCRWVMLRSEVPGGSEDIVVGG